MILWLSDKYRLVVQSITLGPSSGFPFWLFPLGSQEFGPFISVPSLSEEREYYPNLWEQLWWRKNEVVFFFFFFKQKVDRSVPCKWEIALGGINAFIHSDSHSCNHTCGKPVSPHTHKPTSSKWSHSFQGLYNKFNTLLREIHFFH